MFFYLSKTDHSRLTVSFRYKDQDGDPSAFLVTRALWRSGAMHDFYISREVSMRALPI